MIDSTNPRQMADNINMLAARPTGTEVKANPAGSTGDHVLTKIQIGSTKYAVGGGVTKTVLYNPEVPASVDTTDTEVELDSVVTGYDYILVYTGNHDERSVGITTPEDLESTEKALIQSAGDQYFVLSVDSTDHKTLSIRVSNGSGRVLYKVVGIKL